MGGDRVVQICQNDLFSLTVMLFRDLHDIIMKNLGEID